MSGRILAAAATLYLGFGLCLGLATRAAIPAVNGAGVAYITVAWPGFVQGSPIKAPIPSWVFSFAEHA